MNEPLGTMQTRNGRNTNRRQFGECWMMKTVFLKTVIQHSPKQNITNMKTVSSKAVSSKAARRMRCRLVRLMCVRGIGFSGFIPTVCTLFAPFSFNIRHMQVHIPYTCFMMPSIETFFEPAGKRAKKNTMRLDKQHCSHKKKRVATESESDLHLDSDSDSANTFDDGRKKQKIETNQQSDKKSDHNDKNKHNKNDTNDMNDDMNCSDSCSENLETPEAMNSLIDGEKHNETCVEHDKTPYAWNQMHFHPITNAGWKKGEHVPYAALTTLFSMVEKVSGRLEIIRMVANYFRSVIHLTPKEVVPSIYLMTNKIAPPYEGKEMGVASATVIAALAESTGANLKELKMKIQKNGDIGDVAISERSCQKTLFGFKQQTLTVDTVFKTLKEMAEVSGKNANDTRKTMIKKLLVACQGQDAKYLTRALSGNLRIGLAEKSVITALARAVTLTPPGSDNVNVTHDQAERLQSSERLIKQAYIEVPSHDKVVSALLEHGVYELQKHCYLQPGVPVKCMLGKPANGVQAILDKFSGNPFTIEYKYDGERSQIHLLSDGTIRIYSRNCENHTSKYPDVIRNLPHAYDNHKIKNFILDAEIVAWDATNGKILSFQTLSHRRRKDVDESQIEVKVSLFAFDLLYLNDTNLMSQPFQERRTALRENFIPVLNEFQFAMYKDTDDPTEINIFLTEAVNNQCEGLMVKSLAEDAAYLPAKRNWLKVKKDYLQSGGDTFDLVVVGAYHGKGKRTGVYGAFLLACYDEDNEEYQTICKVGTGFSENVLEQAAASLEPHIVSSVPRYYRYSDRKNLIPDVWFNPKVVWEVLAADLSISPEHKAASGIVDPEKGIALRFPRFLRVREDKNPEDSTSAKQVVGMFQNQSSIQGHKHRSSTSDDEEEN